MLLIGATLPHTLTTSGVYPMPAWPVYHYSDSSGSQLCKKLPPTSNPLDHLKSSGFASTHSRNPVAGFPVYFFTFSTPSL